MTDAIRFFVPGEPQSKARPRTVRLPNGSMTTYTPRETKAYEELVRALAMRARAGSSWARSRSHADERWAIRLELRFATARRRDVDNVAKAILDGLIGAFFVDDWQVSSLLVARVLRHPEPGAYVLVTPTREVFAA